MVSPRLIGHDNDDGTIWLWDLETKKKKATYEGHTGETWALDISPDDTVVVSGSYDRTIRIWPIGGKDTKPLAVHKTSEDVAILTIHKSFVATAYSVWRGGVQLTDIVKDTTVATLKQGETQGETFWILRFSSDSQRLYGATIRGRICYWEVGDLLLPSESPTRPRELEHTVLGNASGASIGLSITYETTAYWFACRVGLNP